jgi:hypothetical protein
LFALRVGEKEENLITADQVVDDPDTSAFSCACKSPADLPKALGVSDKIAGFWIGNKDLLEFRIRLIANELCDLGRKDVGLIENRPRSSIRRWRMMRKSKVSGRLR